MNIGSKRIGGQVPVSLHDNVNFAATRADIEEVVSGYAGFLHTVDTYRPERTSQALARAQDQFTVRIYGHDLDVLSKKAEEVRQTAAGVAGVADARFIPIQKEPQLEIEVDLAAAETHRIKPGGHGSKTAKASLQMEVGMAGQAHQTAVC